MNDVDNNLLKPVFRNKKKRSNNNSKIQETSAVDNNLSIIENRNLDNSVFYVHNDIDNSDICKRVY